MLFNTCGSKQGHCGWSNVALRYATHPTSHFRDYSPFSRHPSFRTQPLCRMHSDRLISSQFYPSFARFTSRITLRNGKYEGEAAYKKISETISGNARTSNDAIWRGKCPGSNTRFYENAFASNVLSEVDCSLYIKKMRSHTIFAVAL